MVRQNRSAALSSQSQVLEGGVEVSGAVASPLILNEATVLVPVSDVSPHPRNVNRGDVGKISESIRHDGFFGSLIVQRSSGHILAGTHRWRAAREAGFDELPVTFVDVDDDTALRIMLADNRTARLGDDDPAELAELLKEIHANAGSLIGTAYTTADLDNLLTDLSSDLEVTPDPGASVERAKELREKWGVESGQAWTIPSGSVPGSAHRIVCGDATVATDAERCLDGTTPQLMVTDPPYGVSYDADWRNRDLLGARAAGKVRNDDRADWREAWALFPGDVAYVWHGSTHCAVVQQSLEATGFTIRSQIIWAKDSLVISRGHYHWQHEPCWYAVRAKGRWSGDRSQTTLWRIGHRNSDTGHSTQKPVECMRRPIENNSVWGDSVYDPFLGSGTTLVAAEEVGRLCHGLEIDPGYVAVALERAAGMDLSPRLEPMDG